MHDFRMVKGYSHTNLIFDVAVPSGCSIGEQELKNQIQEKVREAYPEKNYYTVVGIDHNYTELV